MVLAVLVVALVAMVSGVNGDFLAGYIADKTFGYFPEGPCTVLSPCTGDAANMPDSVKNIDVCLLGDNSGCGKLGDLIKGGTYKIWDLQCSSISVENVAINHDPNQMQQNLGFITARLTVNQFRMKCTFRGDIENLILEILGVVRITSTIRDGDFRFHQTQSMPGTEIDNTVILEWEGKSMTEEVPQRIRIPADQCDIVPDLGLTLTMTKDEFEYLQICVQLFGAFRCASSENFFWSIIFALINWSAFISAIANILEGLIGGVTCQIIAEMAIFDEGTAQEADGLINQIWNEIQVEIDEAAQNTADDIRYEDSDAGVMARFGPSGEGYLTAQMLDDSLDLANSTLAELISVALNNWLGGDDLVINELMNEYANNGPGSFTTGDISGDGFKITEEAQITKLTIAANSFEISGLNTFRRFKVLQNGYDDDDGILEPYARSFNNSIYIESISFIVNVDVLMERGKWVTESCNYLYPNPKQNPTCSSDSYSFTFSYAMSIRDLELDAAMLAVVNPSELDDTQIGAVMNIPDRYPDRGEQWFRLKQCIAPAFYALRLSSLAGSVSEFEDIELVGFDGDGLNDLLDGSLEFMADATRGALKTKFPGLAQGPIREFLNNITRDDFVSWNRNPYRNCRPYQRGFGPEDLKVDFKDGFAQYFYLIINDAIGGNPINNTETDINELVETVLKFYETKGTLPIDSWDNKTNPSNPTPLPAGTWQLPDDVQESLTLPEFNGPGYLGFTEFEMRNFNTIYKLTASHNDEAVDGGLDFLFGFAGQMGNKNGGLEPQRDLQFEFKFKVRDDNKGMNEEWYFLLELENLELGFLMNEVEISLVESYLLTFGQLDNYACPLSTLKRVLFPQDNRLSRLEKLDFVLTPDISQGNQVNSPKLVKALYGLQDPTLNPLDPDYPARIRTRDRFKGLINSAARGTMNYILDTIEDIPANYKDRLKYEYNENDREWQVVKDYDGNPVKDPVTYTNCDFVNDPFTGSKLPPDEPIESTLCTDLEWATNFTYFGEYCLKDVNNTATRWTDPVGYEIEQLGLLTEEQENDIYNFQDSFLIDLIQGFAGSQATVDRILISIANSTGNFLSDVFVLAERNGETQVDLRLPLGNLGFIFTGEPILYDAILDMGTLEIDGFNKVIANSYEIMKPMSRMTLRHSFQFDDVTPLDVRLRSTIEVDRSTVNETGSGTITEVIYSNLTLTGLKVAFDTMIAVNETEFGAKTLGHFFYVISDQTFFLSDQAFDCLFSTLVEGGISLPYLDIQINDMDGPVVQTLNNELLSPSMELFVEAVIEQIRDFYFDAIPNICDNCIREFVNCYLEEKRFNASSPELTECKAPLAPGLSNENRYYRFNQAKDFINLQNAIQEYIIDDDFNLFNTVVESALTKGFMLESKGNNIRFQNIPVIYNGVNYGTVGISAKDIYIYGGGTFDEFRFLEPYYTVDDSIPEDRRELVVVNVTDSEPEFIERLSYTTYTHLHIDGPMRIVGNYDFNSTDFFVSQPNMANVLKVTFNITDLDLRMKLYMKVDIVKALELRFSSISSIEELPCLFVPVSELEPESFSFNTTSMEVDIECIGPCDLFKLYEAGGSVGNENGGQIAQLVNQGIEWFTAYIDSRGAQTAIDSFLSSAPNTCAEILGLIDQATDIPEETLLDVAQSMGAVFLGAAALGGFFAVALFPTHKKRRQAMMSKVLARHKDVTDDEVLAGIMAMMELKMKSLFQHPMVNKTAKFVVPFICLGNIIGLVYAIVFAQAANIVITFTVLGQTTQSIDLVPFTIRSTINDMWNSGAWPLAVLIGVASCAWPVVKNAILLGLWFLPATIMGAKKRRSILELLDILGKWSFLDVYVIVIMLGALRTYVNASYLSYVAFLDEEFFVTDVTVRPEPGIIVLCFVCATSLLINHAILFFHDRVTYSNNISEDKINGNFVGKVPQRAAVRRRVIDHVFVGRDKEGNVRAVSKPKSLVLLGVAFLALVFILIGVFMPFVTFELNGLVGILLDFFEEQEAAGVTQKAQLGTKTYSIMDLGSALGDAPTTTAFDVIVLFFFKLLYYITVLIAPLCNVLLTAALLLVPLNLPNLKALYFWTKISSYWAALEVFTVGIIATIIEIRPVTAFIVDFITNDVCGFVTAAIAVLVDDADKDAFCLDVIGKFEATAPILVAGVVFQLTFFWFVTVLAHAVTQDRYYAAYHNLRSDVKPKRLGRLHRMTIKMVTFTFKGGEGSGLEGLSSFADLDADNNDQVEVEKTDIDRCFDWCCSTEKGIKAADDRIAAWQSKFGVQSSITQSTSNPVYSTPATYSVSSSQPSPAPSTSARVRSGSADSVEV